MPRLAPVTIARLPLNLSPVALTTSTVLAHHPRGRGHDDRLRPQPGLEGAGGAARGDGESAPPHDHPERHRPRPSGVRYGPRWSHEDAGGGSAVPLLDARSRPRPEGI